MSRIVVVVCSGIIAIIAIMCADTYNTKGFIFIFWLLSLGLLDYFITIKNELRQSRNADSTIESKQSQTKPKIRSKQ